MNHTVFPSFRIRAMSNVSRLDPKSPSRSPAPSLYAGQTGEANSRTWKSEIKSAFIPFDLDEFQEGGIGTKIIACLMSPLFILSKFTAPVLDEENLEISWNKVNTNDILKKNEKNSVMENPVGR